MPIDFGYDASGRGNNWTANNLSSTAGAGNDSMVDSPTSYGTDTGVGGTVRGNYCTWNSALPAAIAGPSIVTLSNGNLDVAFLNQTVGDMFLYATNLLTSGKWYWEFTLSGTTNNNHRVGVSSRSFSATTGNTEAVYWWNQGLVYVNGTQVASGLSTCTTNDVIGIAINADAGSMQWFKNGVSLYTATGVNYTTYIPYMNGDGGSGRSFSGTTNFGQRAFAYTAPSGFKALCTQNLPTPTIGATSTTQANDYFNTIIWTGDSNSTGTTRTQTGVGFQPDFVWIKNRSNAYFHNLYDSVRGSGSTKNLSSNTTGAEGDSGYAGLYGYLSAFQTDGFQTTNGTDGANSGIWVNALNENFVAWCWNAGGSTVTNTSGTISAQVRANTTSGFSVVTYTGTGATATVGHGLGAVPGMIIAKRRSATQNWGVAHSALSGTQTLYLDLTQGAATGVWNGTPTSTVFNITTDGVVNASGSTYVAYCFAPVAGYSAFGSFTGNGSADGVFVYTGFRPEWVMLKSSTQAYRWYMLDAARNTYNVMNGRLFANNTNAEATNSDILDFTSNGFKIRTSDAEVNGSGQTIIYACFAESPFKYALAR